MQQSPLSGYSIVEDELFIARCLQIVLQGAGAKVHRTRSVREAWTFIGEPKLSAAVLDCKHGIRGDHAIARRLAGRGLPFVFYGAAEPYRHEAWPNAPVMGKLASGAQIVEALRGLLQPPPASMRGRRRYRCGCERPGAPHLHYGRCRRTDEAAKERWAAPS